MTASTEALARVAMSLGPLANEVVFVGGAVVELLVTDTGAPASRPTDDVDAVVEVATYAQYVAFTDRLRARGASEDRTDGAPLCRWILSGVHIDVMPPTPEVLGFSNRWYSATVEHSVRHRLPGGHHIRVAAAPFFLATKLEAFKGRGGGDFIASHDLEDVVAIVDGRPELVDEVRQAPSDLRTYLEAEMRRLLGDPRFVEAIPGHLPSDDEGQSRSPIVYRRLMDIAGGCATY